MIRNIQKKLIGSSMRATRGLPVGVWDKAKQGVPHVNNKVANITERRLFLHDLSESVWTLLHDPTPGFWIPVDPDSDDVMLAWCGFNKDYA